MHVIIQYCKYLPAIKLDVHILNYVYTCTFYSSIILKLNMMHNAEVTLIKITCLNSQRNPCCQNWLFSGHAYLDI